MHHFERARATYTVLLQAALGNRKPFIVIFLAIVLASFVLVPFLGQNFFPSVDGGQILMHVRAPVGTRVEETSHVLDLIEREIRAIIPPDELLSVVNNIGLSISGINTTYSSSGTVGPQDGDVYISLTKGHRPSAEYVRALRARLPRDFPAETFSFLPADIVSQILNFGSPAPIDIQVTGPDAAASAATALKILRRIREIPGVADPRILQSSHYPELRVDVDRTRIDQTGFNEQDVTNSIGTSLAGTSQSFPVFWVDPHNNVSYPVVVQIPEDRIDSLDRLQGLPVSSARGSNEILGGEGSITRGEASADISHYNIQRAIDIFATTQNRDLGAVASDVQHVLNDFTKHNTSRGLTITMRGQYQTMNTAFSGLGFGLLAAIVLIYLLIVVNFQSWLDPFVIITALPAALAGIVWMLFGTGTTLSVPALTGAIMCMGVATANSILIVSFARERLDATGDAMAAALEAGVERFRPVLMTALAMIIGMIPMALGLGEGGEQNAPLGRAVIGGLMFATVATLIFVPVVFSIVHGRRGTVAAATGEAYA